MSEEAEITPEEKLAILQSLLDRKKAADPHGTKLPPGFVHVGAHMANMTEEQLEELKGRLWRESVQSRIPLEF